MSPWYPTSSRTDATRRPSRASHAAIALILALALAPAVASADNLLANPGFDTDFLGWTDQSGDGFLTEWAAEDASGSPTSGSLRMSYMAEGEHSVLPGSRQCVPITPGVLYDFGSRVKVPTGQDREGTAYVQVSWYANASCSDNLDFSRMTTSTPSDSWQLLHTGGFLPPAGTHSAEFGLLMNAGGTEGTVALLFDDAYLCPSGDCSEAPPPSPPYANWIASPGLPGFEAQVRITPPGKAPLEGQEESFCIPETICARGAVDGRPEIFAKVIGPRPNGHLWVQLIRFTPSQVEVWLRQVSTLEVNYYVLQTVPPGAGFLSGIEDRGAFLP